MKHFISTLALLLSFTLVAAQGVLDFKVKEHDFGTIQEGVQAEYTFAFKNTGNAPIVITNVQASCGCTTPEWTREPIMPGETGSIKAVYNSTNRPGTFFKTITITSNASEPSFRLNIKGNVIQKASPSPTQNEKY